MNLTHKARMVAEGNLAKPDSDVPVYASVVPRESVRILLAIASLNNMKVRAADITNAFLNAPCLENICFKAGPEFGDKEGQWVIVRRALYGLVSSSAAFAIHRNQVLYDMGSTGTRSYMTWVFGLVRPTPTFGCVAHPDRTAMVTIMNILPPIVMTFWLYLKTLMRL